MKSAGSGLAALFIALLAASILLPRLRRFRHEGPFRVEPERRGFSANFPLETGKPIPPALPRGLSCGLDGRCRVFAWIDLPAGVDASALSGRTGTLDHVEFTLPGLEAYAVTAQTLVVDGRRVLHRPRWKVYGAYALLSVLPLLGWAAFAAVRGFPKKPAAAPT